MTEINTELDDLLTYDPILEAESITGESIKTDGNTSKIGILLSMMNSKELNRLLSQNNDTVLGLTPTKIETILSREGFTQIHSDIIKRKNYASNEYDYKTWWWNKTDGLLIYNETCRDSTLKLKMYFNWAIKHKDIEKHIKSNYSVMLPDGKETFILAGELNVKEGLLHYIAKMKKYGLLLPQWKFLASNLTQLTNQEKQAMPETIKEILIA